MKVERYFLQRCDFLSSLESGLISTTMFGRTTSSFIRSINVVPPASGWMVPSCQRRIICGHGGQRCAADAASVAR
jgi:hypothetical protein